MARKSVLIVDDDSVTAGLYRKFLTHKGMQTHVAETGYDALEYLAEYPVYALVTDMNMPGMDGSTLLQAVKKQYRDIRVMVMSGSDLNTAELKLLGAMDVLIKPISLHIFYATLISALEGQRATQRLMFQVPVYIEGISGASIDVSADGMLVKSMAPLPAGRDLRVVIGENAVVESFTGTVLRCRMINSLYYTALHFVDSVGEELVRHIRGTFCTSTV